MGVIIGTAGHIDHGKSTLMLKLTGRDPDRLKEEKARGITIELGYVFMETPSGKTISCIDVPGHEKFVKTMVAGVSTVDCFLLVVSADEGVMPQTREHLDILRLLEVDRGIVALSKCDLVDEELIELAQEEVMEALKGTPAEGAPVVRVSSVTGQGIEQLREAIVNMAESIEGKSSEGRFKMPVDRIFSLKGFGTIICGTGLSGTVREGDTIELQPAGKQYRLRELGVNDTRNVKSGTAGDRIALNLTGLKKEDVHRGSVAGEPGFLKILSSLDTICTMLSGDIDLLVRQRVRFHVGTAEVMARAIPVEGHPLLRGETGYVHCQLEHPVVAMPGDRFVIRRYSPVVTIGGGVILDTDTSKVRSRFRAARMEHLDLLSNGKVEDLLYEAMEDAQGHFIQVRSWIDRTGVEPVEFQEAVESLEKQGRAVTVGDGKSARIMLTAAVEDLQRKILGSVRTFHRRVPLSPGLPSAFLARNLPSETPVWAIRFTLAELEEKGEIERRGEFLAVADFPADLEGEHAVAARYIVSDIEKAGLKGCQLPLSNCTSEDVDGLIARGMVILLTEGLVSTPVIYAEAVRKVNESFGTDQFRLGELRESLGVSRRIALLWAELMDSFGDTKRIDDCRVLTGRD